MAWSNICIAALLLSLFVLRSVCDAKCPPPEDMSPCSCTANCTNCPAQMSCSEVHSVHDLISVFDKTKNYPFKDLVVENSVLLYLPSKGVEEKGFRRLHLRNNHMGKIFQSAPSSNLLNEIWIKKTRIQAVFHWDLFSNLTELKRFVIVDMEVRKLSKKFGDNMPQSLKSVWLENTKTSQIESGAFEKLVHLETLYVTKSNIRELDRSILPRPSYIKTFMILNSRIQSLPEDLFSEMPEINHIVLSGNLISKFQRSVFENVLPGLSMLSLDNNPLRCDCATRWVTEVRQFPRFFSAKCSGPTELEGRRLNVLKRNDFRQCPGFHN